MPAKSWKEYSDTLTELHTADVKCLNDDCEFRGFVVENVAYTSEYPQIFCGECSEQILEMDRGNGWETIEDKETYFGQFK